jgi:hypothetical protein
MHVAEQLRAASLERCQHPGVSPIALARILRDQLHAAGTRDVNRETLALQES